MSSIRCVMLCVYVFSGYFFYLGGVRNTRYVQHVIKDISYIAGYIGLVCAKGNTVEPVYNGHLWGPTFRPL